MTDLIVIGAGPAGMLATLRAAELGARTAMVAKGEFGGMAANDGPIPVRQAARLMREARQLGGYGVSVSEPVLDYRRLLARVRDVVADVDAHMAPRQQIDALGVTIHEDAGAARFADPHTTLAEVVDRSLMQL
jgi:pyruvate/2-oxoglutarate dehydrogenase complex dihydrolipoamide dehydrogenase (E3) component